MQAALSYLRRGWSVVPLKPKGKEPLIKWTEYIQRRATESELSEWFAGKDTNLGLVTGSISGFVVVDVDGNEGLESAQKLGLSSNTIALTGKGKQFFYRIPLGCNLKNSVRLLPGIDIRSDGGYVCAPPSIHPNGKRYTWLIGPSQSLPSFPDALVSIAKQKNFSTTYTEANQGEKLSWVSEVLKSLEEGNRNDTFTRVVGKLHHQGMDKASIYTILLPHARACGFTDSELNTVIQSIGRYSTDLPTDIQADSADQFLSDYTPVDWICKPILARQAFGFVAGLPESYKTWLLMDLSIECARGGGLWLGLFPVSRARVLFIDQERAKNETQRRFRSLLAAKHLDSKELKSSLFIRAGTSTRLDHDESFSKLKRIVADIQPDIIMIDSFATFHTSDEKDRTTIQKVIERIKEIRSEFKCSVVFIDHEGKAAYSDKREGILPSAGRLVGSIAKVAAADFVLTVRRIDPETCAVYHTKSTLGPKSQDFAVHVMDTANGGVKCYGEIGQA